MLDLGQHQWGGVVWPWCVVLRPVGDGMVCGPGVMVFRPACVPDGPSTGAWWPSLAGHGRLWLAGAAADGGGYVGISSTLSVMGHGGLKMVELEA